MNDRRMNDRRGLGRNRCFGNDRNFFDGRRRVDNRLGFVHDGGSLVDDFH
jgi:hypothetical protein